MSLHADRIIQNYRLIRFLGDGGMGQVWLAEHTLLGRKVAIKCLHSQYARNSGIRARFKQEASTLAHLHHPRIVALHDYIEDDDGAYLVMEFVDGIPLDDYILNHSGPIPDPLLRDLFGQILEGFVYAHGKMIVHRDIKPGNFLVTPEGKVKILDFGIAKILSDSDRKLTKTGMNMGTVFYMSPEQVKGEVVDFRSDIYSLGVTLFQMATGRSPYPSDTTEFYVYDQIVNHPLPSASTFYPGVTASVEAIIAKATAKLPAQRFQDCREFLEALRTADFAPSLGGPVTEPVREEEFEETEEDFVAEVPSNEMAGEQATAVSVEAEVPFAVEEAPVDAPTPAPTRKRRRRWPWVVLMVLLLGGGAWFVTWFYLEKSRPEALWVVAEDVNLWEKPAKKGEKNELPFGAQVEVLGKEKDGWREVRYKGKQGYVNAYLLLPLEEYQVIRHAMDKGMKYWLNMSWLRISLATYFRDHQLKADLPADVFQEVYGVPKSNQEVWKAAAYEGKSEYNTVIRGMQLEQKSNYSDREYDNAVIITSNKGGRRLITFSHEKHGDGYRSKVLAEMDLRKYPGQEIRIAAAEKLRNYTFDNKYDVLNQISLGKFPILLADPRRDKEATLLVFGKNNRFDVTSIKRNTSFWPLAP